MPRASLHLRFARDANLLHAGISRSSIRERVLWRTDIVETVVISWGWKSAPVQCADGMPTKQPMFLRPRPMSWSRLRPTRLLPEPRCRRLRHYAFGALRLECWYASSLTGSSREGEGPNGK